MAEAPKTVEPESNVQKAAVASDAFETETKKGERKPSKEIRDIAKEEQERNDARKADKVDEDNLGTGLPPVVSAVNDTVPVPVSTDAPQKEQDRQVRLQSAGPRVESDEKTKISLRDGKDVTVNRPLQQVEEKLRDGNIVQFREDDGSAQTVNPEYVVKVESA